MCPRRQSIDQTLITEARDPETCELPQHCAGDHLAHGHQHSDENGSWRRQPVAEAEHPAGRDPDQRHQGADLPHATSARRASPRQPTGQLPQLDVAEARELDDRAEVDRQLASQRLLLDPATL